MLKGDLGTTPLAEVLTTLADTEATGCLHLDPSDGGDEALIYVKAGSVYSAHVPGRRPQLGARLVSSGALPPEALEEALEAQQTELHGWRLGELLVHLGYVDQTVVSAFVIEQLRESAYDLAGWREGTWKFRKNEKTREDVGGRSSVADLLAEVDRRRSEWKRIRPVVQGPDAIPVLSSLGMSEAEMTLDQDQWALLCKVDGERNLAQLARDCGFTTFEAGQVVHALVEGGLLEVETAMGEYDHLDEDEDAPDEDAEPMSTAEALGSAIAMLGGKRPAALDALAPAAAPASPPPAPPEPVEIPAAPAPVAAALLDPPPVEAYLGTPDLSEWADLLDDSAATEGESELGRMFSFGGSAEPEPAPAPAPEQAVSAPDDDPLSKVSEALSALLDSGLEAAEPPRVTSLSAILPDEPSPMDPAELEVLERTRAAAAEELALAHAEAEREREAEESQSFGEIEALVASLREQAAPPPPPPPADPPPLSRADIIAAEDEAARRAEAIEREEAARAAEVLAAQQAEVLAAQQAEELAAQQAEVLAAHEAEQRANEEAERLAAQEADRLAQEEADRLVTAEANRAAAERAAAEQSQLHEAAEAERRAAEDAELLAAQQAELLAAREAEQAAPPPPPAFSDVAAALRDVGGAEPAAAAAAAPTDDYVDDRDDEERAEDDAAYAASQRRQDNDTASLLRELSSLGLDDESRSAPPLPPARPSTPPRQAPPAGKDAKKRKGLFGR